MYCLIPVIFLFTGGLHKFRLIVEIGFDLDKSILVLNEVKYNKAKT